jgi:hypothetical protein
MRKIMTVQELSKEQYLATMYPPMRFIEAGVHHMVHSQ